MIPPVLLPKIAKLVPLLGSDRDTEVLATVRAIRRTLASAGSDLHALADTLESLGLAARAVSAAQPSYSGPDAPCSRPGMPLWNAEHPETWSVVALNCLSMDWTIPKRHGGRFLSPEERARLKRIERYQAPVTNADAAWIAEVVERCKAAQKLWNDRTRSANAYA